MKFENSLRFALGSLFIFGLCFSCFAQIPPYIAGQQGPAGGGGGDRCSVSDVAPEWQLASINVRSGDVVDAVDFTFNVPGAPEPPAPIHCGGTGGTPGRLLTLDSGEFIVRVLGKYKQRNLSTPILKTI